MFEDFNLTEEKFVISEAQMQEIYDKESLWIWVPKIYGGLGCNFAQGLQILYDWAKKDGSLGWMITLCSGANYFSRNLKPEVAMLIFNNKKTCFGGSGMIGGTAEILDDKTYLINGLWRYATGAPHLTHFTLNAIITENGIPIKDNDNNEVVRSFVIPKDKIAVIPDWKSMGMKSTGTYSFSVENVEVGADYSFVYNEFFSDDVMDKIPFRVFADLTLLVNYLGLADHFMKEAEKLRPQLDLKTFKTSIEYHLSIVFDYARDVENILSHHDVVSEEKQKQIHQYGVDLVQNLSSQIISIYRQLGISATDTKSEVYKIFCDYFTAAMHANFRKAAAEVDFSF
ncbi:hypothetical protein [Soonwooa sp.]|uniref:hypothetical protein n=1 Tax=Soonwooa sp. TaxID=1938592 RepID=UPI002629962E|nr:hypothetical protein [Soonwooa sp.]